MKKYKRLGDFFYLGIVAAGLVWLLFEAMQYFGFVWFDKRTAWVVWGVVIAILFMLT